MSPASSLPSLNLYRGSLLALLAGTAVALWLIVRPPGSSSGNQIVLSELTPTATISQAKTRTPASPTVAPVTAVATPTQTPAATPTATPGPRSYVVQDGDTLIDIATSFAPPGVDPYTYAQQIAFASGLGSVDAPISPGQTLTLP